jgi:hypothetical protein
MSNFPTPLEEVIHHNVIKNNKTGGPALDVGQMKLLWRALGENTGYTFSIFESTLAPGMGIVDLGPLIEWPTPGNDLTEKLGPNVPPEALSMVWKNRLTLSPVGGGTDVWLNPSDPNLDSMTSVETAVPISLSTTAALQDSKLYDLKLHSPVGEVYNLSPHCVYAKTSWDNFGLFHITDIHLSLRNQQLRDALIVGMHVPPFSPVNSEFPYYLRETVHPTTDPALTQEYLSRNSFKTDGWTNNGTPYFRIGEIGNGLDNGVISEYGMDFVRLLAGVGAEVTRPVDLFLCGHHHQRMEYRLKWNGSDVQFYMDFYMESPSTYYSTTAPKDFSDGQNTLKKGEPIAIKIDPAAPATGSFSTTIAQENTPQGPLSEVRGTMSLPPYSDTLDATKDPKTWWQNHRPIVAQTAALGPIDPRQRFDPRWKVTYTFLPGSPFVGQPPITVTVESKTQPKPSVLPGEVVAVRRIMTAHADPTFNGFRFIQVEGNIIQKVRYINLADLRAANFTLPWEPIRTGPIRPDPIRVDPAKLTT